CQPGRCTLELDAHDLGDTLPLAEAGNSTEVLVLVALQRLVEAAGPQVLRQALGLTQGVLGIRDTGSIRQTAGDIRTSVNVARGPGVVNSADLAVDLQVGVHRNTAAGLDRDIGGADPGVGHDARCPDQGVCIELLGHALV